MPYISCTNSPSLAAIMLTLTLTLLVTSADGFNVLRARGGIRQLPSKNEIQDSAKRSVQAGASRFVVVLDAGSSSTKVNVFEFHVGSEEGSGAAGTLPVSVTEVSSGKIKVKPSLDSFADESDGDKLREYFSGAFESLTSNFQMVLPPSDTSLYVLATAGMRQLQKTDAEKARKLIEEVRTILSNKTLNPYSFHEDHFRILNGKVEGIYAWMAANFLNGFFHTSDMSRDDSVGVLEMGGSSLQMAYMLPQASREGCDVEVRGHPSMLHVDSFAGFGASAVIDQVLGGLCADVGNDGRGVDNPCMLTGDSAQMTCNGDDQKVAVNGASNPTQCTTMLEDIVEGSVSEQDAGSLLFYAIGAFRHSLETLRAVDSDTGLLDIDRLRENAKVYCGKTKADAAIYKGSDKYVSDDCIQGLFIMELLDRLDLDDNVIKVSQKINEKKISWALGAALDFTTQDISIHCNIMN